MASCWLLTVNLAPNASIRGFYTIFNNDHCKLHEHIAWCNIPCNAILKSFFLTLWDKFRDKLLGVAAPLVCTENFMMFGPSGCKLRRLVFPIIYSIGNSSQMYRKNKNFQNAVTCILKVQHREIFGIDYFEHEYLNSEVHFWQGSVESEWDEKLMTSTRIKNWFDFLFLNYPI
jgi:hypothetical protein